MGLGLLATGGLYTAVTADVNQAHAQAADAALLQRGPGALQRQRLHQLPRRNLQGVRPAARA